MTTFTKVGSEIWRQYETDGVPASGRHDIQKSDMRAWMAVVETALGVAAYEGLTTVASAATVDLAGTATQGYLITGTTTISSFGTSAPTGAIRFVRFSGALTITHNATSMICPAGADIVGDAGMRMIVWHEGSGNWRVLWHRHASGKMGFGVEPTALVHIAAGTASVPPVKFASGVVLTAALAGVEEYDGKAFYATPVDSNRAIKTIEHVAVSAADAAGSNVNTAQQWFATGAITLAAATAYEFEGELVLTRAAGTTSHTTAVLFGGSATLTSIRYIADVTNPTGNVLAAVNRIYGTSASAVTLTAANTSATENIVLRVSGIVRVNAAGTFIPQFQYSAAPGGAPTILANSFFRLRPIGDGAMTAVGAWA